MRRTRRHATEGRTGGPGALAPAASATPAGATPAPRNAILQLQHTIGNRAVQRQIEAALAREGRGPGGGVDIVDTRVELVEVAVASKPSLKERKVTYKEEKETPTSSLGTTESKLTIEYAVDAETGAISIGAIRPEYVITISTPYIGREDFVRKFGPIMEKLWDQYDGDIMAFSKSADVRNFHYEPQTKRHEEMHVTSRQLALRDIVPDYLGYMRREGFLDAGVSKFKDQTHFYLKTAWDEKVEKIVSHEQIYYLDAVTMVEEYRQRMSEEEAEDPWAKLAAEGAKALGFGGQ